VSMRRYGKYHGKHGGFRFQKPSSTQALGFDFTMYTLKRKVDGRPGDLLKYYNKSLSTTFRRSKSSRKTLDERSFPQDETEKPTATGCFKKKNATTANFNLKFRQN